FLFFFQAEDGIRVRTVTGVQTCALPICVRWYDDSKATNDETARRVASGFVALESSYHRTPLASPTRATRWGMVAYAPSAPTTPSRSAPTSSAAAAAASAFVRS